MQRTSEKRVQFAESAIEHEVKKTAKQTAKDHAERQKRIQEFIDQNPIAVELVEQIFYTRMFMKKMNEKLEQHLTEIQSELKNVESQQKIPEDEEEKSDGRHPEAKQFDKLTLDEKFKLVAQRVRQNQMINLAHIKKVHWDQKSIKNAEISCFSKENLDGYKKDAKKHFARAATLM